MVFPRDHVFTAVAPNPTTAIMLKRITYWCQHAKVSFDEKLWTVGDLDWWASDTGLSVRQVRRSIETLKRSGMIECEAHMFGSRKLRHMRVATGTHEELQRANRSAPSRANRSARMRANLLSIKKESIKESHKGVEFGKISEGDLVKKKRAERVAEVAQKFKERLEAEKSEDGLEDAIESYLDSGSMKTLERVWRSAWLRGEYGLCPTWGQKAVHGIRGMANQIADREITATVISETVEHWLTYREWMRARGQKKITAEVPSPGWITATWKDAVMWIDERHNASTASACTEDTDEGWDLL